MKLQLRMSRFARFAAIFLGDDLVSGKNFDICADREVNQEQRRCNLVTDEATVFPVLMPAPGIPMSSSKSRIMSLTNCIARAICPFHGVSHGFNAKHDDPVLKDTDSAGRFGNGDRNRPGGL